MRAYLVVKSLEFWEGTCLHNPYAYHCSRWSSPRWWPRPRPYPETIALPDGYEAQVRPRSGLAIRRGVTCLNSPGTIDADYRGEVCVVLANFGSDPVVIARGDRIAQLIVAPVARARFEVVEELPATQRGSGGFGSTDRDA